MAIKSGRVGVRHDQVDHYGRIKNVAGGIYSNLSAGSLVSSSSADSSKVNTPSSFTGKIDLTSIKGNTIKWNQLQNGISATTTSNGVTFTKTDDTKLTLSGTSTQSVTRRFNVDHAMSIVSGHKYLLRSNHANATGIRMALYQSDWTSAITTSGLADEIITATLTSDTARFCVQINSVGVVTDGITLIPQVFDLTAMFGAGNEPTTVEQFKSMFPLDYYEYDTDSLLSFNADALLNTLTGEQIYLPTLTYFPTGMKSAGNVYDELTESKAITKIGVVDLGTLNWYYTSGGQGRFASGGISSTAKHVTANTEVANIKNAKYSTISAGSVYNGNVGIAIDTGGAIWVYDTTYGTDASAFRTAMSGVYLYYELATSIETDIDVDFNLSLNVNEGENLQLLPVGTDTPASAPLRATVASYKTGATGNDVEKLLGSIAQVETSPATTNHAEGDYIMYNYQLYKVTASITTGASLVVGTNITATTVMDEFKTL